MGKVYTSAEVAKHNSYENCWLIIDGKVYDVTKFMDDHPGGFDVLLSSTGKDATDDFEDIGHTKSALVEMEKYYIGDVEGATITNRLKYTPPKQPHDIQNKTSKFKIKLLQFAVAVLGLAVAVGIYLNSA